MSAWSVSQRLAAAHQRSLREGPRIALVTLFSPQYPTPTLNLSTAELAGYLRHCHPELEEAGRIGFVEPDIALAGTRELRKHFGVPFTLERLQQKRPTLIGLSARIGAHVALQQILGALLVAEWAKDAVIIVGNVLTLAKDVWPHRFPGALYCIGEGELTLEALYGKVQEGGSDLSDVPNLLFWEESSRIFVETTRKPLVLREQSWLPALDMLPANLRVGSDITIRATAGCGAHCTFCSISTLAASAEKALRWQTFPPERTASLIAALAEHGVRSVNLADDEFGDGDLRSALRLADLLRAAENPVTFNVSMRLDAIWRPDFDEQDVAERVSALKQLKAAGLKSVFVGAESASATQLQRYGKGYPVEVNAHALTYLLEAGIVPQIGFIPFDPLVSRWELEDNIRYLRSQVGGKSLYEFVSSPINVMRVQRGTPYIKLLHRLGLLGELEDDLTFYRVKYMDPRMEFLANTMKQWFEEIIDRRYATLQLMRIARNNDAMPASVGPRAAALIRDMHALDLDLLDELLKLFPVDAYDDQLRQEARAVPLLLQPERRAMWEEANGHWRGVVKTNHPAVAEVLAGYKVRRDPIEQLMTALLAEVGWQHD